MAVLDVHFYSDALQVSTAMTVIMPEHPRTLIGLGEDGVQAPGGPAGPPLLYLLHGLSDDESIWLRRTSIDRHAAEKGLAVVMPRAERSFYQDEVHGSAYWTFLSQELPEVVHRFLRVSARREDTFVAGLSMGGYGAMRWALSRPDRFAAAASFSGALDLSARAGALAGSALARSALTGGSALDPDSPFLDLTPDVRDRAFGGHFTPGGDNDLLALLARCDPRELPALWVSCGRRDELLPHSEHFVEAARAAGADPHVEYPDGVHEWGLWDAQIRRVLDWLPLA